jgi:uncharacterized protein
VPERWFKGMSETKRIVTRTQRDFLAAWWRGEAGPLQCGSCSACCYYPGIVVDEKRDRARLPHLLTERSSEGKLVLQRRPEGGCVHLGAHGCTIYDQRPATCRSFDCRVYAAMGIDRHCDDSHQLPEWEFTAQ